MIITKLIGGLGNQMFQYAIARNLAEKNGDILKLDIFEFDTYPDRTYSLYPFNIQNNIASLKEVNRFGVRHLQVWKKVIHKMLFNLEIGKKGYIKEKKFGFDPAILQLSGDIYLDGFWQSEKYFKDIENIIRKEFTFNSNISNSHSDLQEKIECSNSIGIHFRRGDYAFKSSASIKFGICSNAYYQKAINSIVAVIKNPLFIVFSDDAKWVKNNFIIKHPNIFISDVIPNNSDWNELMLMSYCKHNIISNSSFSWWAAWLNKNKKKIVIAPSPWFNINRSESDLIPGNWFKLTKN